MHANSNIRHASLLLLNAWSFNNKWLEINKLAVTHNARLIVITETWLNEEKDRLACTYGCYQKFVSHRQGVRRGGVMCLFNSDFCANELPNSTKFSESCDTLIIKLSAVASVTIAIYWPPICSGADTLNLLKAIEDALVAYVSQGYHSTIFGDLNFPEINWSADPAVATNVYSSTLIELSIAWDVTQIVSEPTRGNSFLDIIITTCHQCLAIAVFFHQ